MIYLKARQRLAEHRFVHPKLEDCGWNYICSLKGNLKICLSRYSLALTDHLLRTHFCHFYLLFCTTICNCILNESLTPHISILFIKSYFYFLIRNIQILNIFLIYVNTKIVYFHTFTYLMSTSYAKQNTNDGERYKTTDANSFYQSSLQLHFSVIHTLQ